MANLQGGFPIDNNDSGDDSGARGHGDVPRAGAFSPLETYYPRSLSHDTGIPCVTGRRVGPQSNVVEPKHGRGHAIGRQDDQGGQTRDEVGPGLGASLDSLRLIHLTRPA